MRKILKNKLNVNLLSGIFLGILFIVACNSASISSPVRAVSALSVYNADDEVVGTFVGFADNRTVSVQLADGKFINLIPPSYAESYLFFASADCSGTPLISGDIANMLRPHNGGYYYLDKEAVVADTVTNSQSSMFNGAPVCSVFTSTQFVGNATLYAGTVPDLVPPYDIR